MSQQELLRRVVRALESAGIEYMLTGSMASSMQGEPRSTHDIDLVVAPSDSLVKHLRREFPEPRFYFESDAVRRAFEEPGMFNLIDVETGDKIDFWALSDHEYDQARFARRCKDQVEDYQVTVSRPEDTILMKLRWAGLSGGSEKQFTDALRVFELQYSVLDHDYMEHWAQALGIRELWSRLRQEANPLR